MLLFIYLLKWNRESCRSYLLARRRHSRKRFFCSRSRQTSDGIVKLFLPARLSLTRKAQFGAENCQLNKRDFLEKLNEELFDETLERRRRRRDSGVDSDRRIAGGCWDRHLYRRSANSALDRGDHGWGGNQYCGYPTDHTVNTEMVEPAPGRYVELVNGAPGQARIG